MRSAHHFFFVAQKLPMDFMYGVYSCFFALSCWLAAAAAANPEEERFGKLGEYAVIVPFSTDSRGRYLSHMVSAAGSSGSVLSSRHPGKRVARSAPVPTGNAAGESRVYYNVTVFGMELHLRLKPNRWLVAPGAFAEWQEDYQELFREPIHRECVFTGDISDMPGATVAISNCDGLAGLIRTESGEFFIEPLERAKKEREETGRAHLVYRRSVMKKEQEGTHKEEGSNEGTPTKKVATVG